MKLLTYSLAALVVLAGVGLTGTAKAQNLSVAEVTSGTYLYTYNITPTFDTSLLTFSFIDPNVTYASGSASNPLNSVSMTAPGNFVEFSFSGATLKGGSTETVAFKSADAPGSFVNIASVGPGGFGGAQSAGPAAVPEASTTVSFGLLLMLGLGSLVVAARRKYVTSAV